SIAKYNSAMSQPIRTQGGEVGIPADRAQGYYEASLAASEEIIASGRYSLYRNNPDPAQNFYETFTNMQDNPEVIWARMFTLNGKYHNFTFDNIPRSLREDNESGSLINPSLNLVEAFEYLDGSSGELRTRDENGDYIYYDDPADIFANKDPRLWGTVIYPGSTFRGQPVECQEGVLRWNESTNSFQAITSTTPGTRYTDGGVLVG